MTREKLKTAKVKDSLKLVVSGGKKKASSKKSAKSTAPSVVDEEEVNEVQWSGWIWAKEQYLWYRGRRIENGMISHLSLNPCTTIIRCSLTQHIGTQWEYEYKVPEYPPQGKALDISRGPDGAHYVDLPDTEPLTGSVLLYDPSAYVVEIPGSAGAQYTPPASAPNNVLRIEEQPVEDEIDNGSVSQQESGSESEYACSLCRITQHEEDEGSQHGTSSQYSVSEAGSVDSWVSEISFKSKSVWTISVISGERAHS